MTEARRSLSSVFDRSALVYKGSPPDHVCVDQALRILPDGTFVVLLVTGGVGEPDIANHIVLSRSVDEGRTWSDTEVVLRFDDRACLLTEVYLHDSVMRVYVSTHSGKFEDWRVYTIESGDGGQSWSDPEPFEPLPRRTFIRNRYIMASGRWVLPFQTYDDQALDDPAASPMRDGSKERAYNGTLFSDDEGCSWQESNRIGPISGWAENNVVELTDGRLAMLIRADKTGHLLRSDSSDGGTVWSDPVPADIPNPGSKFRLWRLSDDRIALIHNPNPATSHPNSKRQANCNRNPLSLWISADDMVTWDYRRVLTSFPGMLAYPDGVIDEREEYIHFVFDYNRHDVIYWAAKLP
jgi:predicted neuraminidase